MDSLELKIPPLLLLIIFAIDAAILAWLAPFADYQMSNTTAYAMLFAIMGILIALAGVWSFRQHRTTVNPTTPQASSTLVQIGVYRLTRNPMYLGFLFLLAALIISLENAVAWLQLPFFIWYLNRFQIIPEERFLTDLFGQAFVEYCARVRRWL